MYPFKNIALNRNRKIIAVANPSADITQMVAKAVPGVADNYRGVWDTSGTYTNGEMVLYSNVVWLCLASTTTATPATGSTVWQAIGSYSAFLGAWSSSTAYVVGDEVTYGGNFYFCTAANTNQTPSTPSSYWQIAGPSNLDNVPDGPTYTKTLGSVQTGNIPDLGKGILGKHLGNIADDPAGNWRRVSGVGSGNLIGFKSFLGDTSGDNTTSLIDAANKRFLHEAMSTGVQGVISSGSQVNVNPTGGVTGNLPYANHDVSVRTTLGATAGGDGSYLNTSQVFNRHLNQATQSGLADDATYLRWKATQQTAMSRPSQGHINDPTFTSVSDFWSNVGTASSGVFTLPAMTANQGNGPTAWNMDGRGNIVKIGGINPGDVAVTQITCNTAATGTVQTKFGVWFWDAAGNSLGGGAPAYAGAAGATTLSPTAIAPANTAFFSVYFQGTSGVSGGNNASVSNPVVRINHETVIDVSAKKAYADFTDNAAGGHIGKVLTNIADDATYTKTLASVQTGNVPDLSKGILGKSLANIADDSGSSRYAVLAVDTNRRAVIDFTQSAHIGKTQSNIADDSNAKMLRFGTLASRPAAGTAGRIYHASDAGTNGITYRDTGSAWVGMAVGHLADINGTLDNTSDGSSRFAVASVDPNKKALIDFSQPGHSNANIQYFGGIQSGTCYDGQAITFNPAYASNPLVIFSGGGMSYSSVTGSAATQSQAFTASSLTTSGFTASLKLVSGGTLTARSDNFTTVTSGSEYKATLTNAPAYNNTYTVNWTLSLGSSSSGTVYIRETNNTGIVLFSKNYATGQNGSKSTSVTWSGATGTSVIDISLSLDGGSTGTISASTVTFTSGTAPSSVSAVPSTAPITWVAFPQT